MAYLPRRSATVFATVLGAILLAGCSDLPDRLTGVSSQQALASQRSDKIRHAIEAQEKHKDKLHKIKGVVGTAVGLLGQAVVQVLVMDGSPRDIPTMLDDVPVQVRVTGMLMAFSDPTTRLRPAPMGYSIGHPAITAGTLGARVTDGTNVFVLSNNHVLANSNAATIGDAEYQPGPYDGGTSADQIATLFAFKPIDFSGGSNTFDAAIARTDVSSTGNSTPTDDGYGAPSTQIFGDANNDRVVDDRNALLGIHVQKYGRTTKLTHGTITGINASVDICYEVLIIFCVKSAHYVDQLIITPGTFSGGGDSGSLIVTDNADKNPVALLFAGSSSETIANRIDLVLNYFNVSIDGSNEPPPPPPPPPDPVTDVGVNSVTSPASVTQGATATVTVVMKNVGNQSVGTFSVTLDDQTDGVPIGTKFVSGLTAGATSTLSYSWSTTSSSIGSHTLVASSQLIDDNAANNTGTATSNIIAAPPAVTDVAVNSITAPSSVTQGTTATVTVIMKNVGNQDVGTFSVNLDDQTDGVPLGTKYVAALHPGAIWTLNYSWNTTSSSIGSHTLVATSALVDDNAANNTGSVTTQVNAFVPTVDIHVGDLDGTARRNGNTWYATVEITVHDAQHNVLNGATVTGNWSRPGLNSNTCTTGELGGNGTCIVLFPSLSNSYPNVIFAVSNVTYPGRTYRQIQNHDPDGSSNGTGQKVLKP